MSMHQYFVIHKPYGMLSQFTREGGHLALADLPFDFPHDVYPVGRLDQDSEGLLIITNDNYFKNTLLSPNRKHFKSYLVQVDGVITDEALAQLRSGVSIKHNKKKVLTAPAKASHFTGINPPERDPPVRFRKNIPTSWLVLEISEGKNRQVRKMTAAVGFPTLRLIRTHIGELSLDFLGESLVKEMSMGEIYHKCGIKA